MTTLLDIAKLRQLEPKLVCLGSYPGIIQSILDFDQLANRKKPSIAAIIASGRHIERYFFGRHEVAIPVYSHIEAMPDSMRQEVNLFIDLSSGRRVLNSAGAALELLPALMGGVVFAEGMPEQHALKLQATAAKRDVWIAGAASVGLMLPGHLKLGAIGGVQARQLEQSRLFEPGNIAVISSSGGMVNEIIRTVAQAGHGLSFAIALGGERFPMTTPQDAFLAAQADPATEAIIYFGELGGNDEYALAEFLHQKAITKPVITYIAGTVAELFETPPQFGHAKAMAAHADESARVKTKALQSAGAQAAATYAKFTESIHQLSGKHLPTTPPVQRSLHLENRRHALVSSTVYHDVEQAEQYTFARIVIQMFLGHPVKSARLEEFVDYTLRLLVDHGAQVSGAVNTIVAARAGKDLVSSLASGLLTIGPRFGGAINEAAAGWLEGVSESISPAQFVEIRAQKGQRIAGIGHRKYRIDLPDPRVQRILLFTNELSAKPFTTFALGVEAETTQKKGNLILNIDGVIAAVLLDLLLEEEHYTHAQLKSLVTTEFFNALFVLSRSVGFMAHYFDQVRRDEGIFRLNPEDIFIQTNKLP